MGGLKTETKPGRPSLMNENIREEIRTELSGRDHWKTTEISKVIEEKSGVRYTRRHIRRIAREWGYALITPKRKHKNSASDEGVEQFKKSRKDTGLSQERNDCSIHGLIRLCLRRRCQEGVGKEGKQTRNHDNGIAQEDLRVRARRPGWINALQII